jgi:hypothetical protein
MRKTEISIPAGLQEKIHWGENPNNGIVRTRENQQRQSLSSFREAKLLITALLLTCEKHKFLSSYSLHEHGY